MKSKQVLDVQQMQHLQEMGLKLKKDTILVWARFMLGKTSISDWEIAYNHSAITDNSQTIPAYTLQDVLDALPKEIAPTTKRYWLRVDLADKCIYYYYDDYNFVEHRKKIFSYDGKDGLIDAAYSLLCWVIEQGYVETNKNE